MSNYEAEEHVEKVRSTLSGVFLSFMPPKSEDFVMESMQTIKDSLSDFVEAKVDALIPNIVEQVEAQVKRILKEALADRPTEATPIDSKMHSMDELQAYMASMEELSDEAILDQFASRLVRGRYSSEQVRRFDALFKSSTLFRSETE